MAVMKNLSLRKSMKSKKTLTLIGSTMAALTLSTAVMAFPGKGDGDCHRFKGDPEQRQEMMEKRADRRLDKMKDYLELTDEQAAQMKTLFEQQMAGKGKGSSPRGIHQAMRDLNPADSDYQDKVNSLIESAQKQMAERMQAQATMRQQVYLLLTPEQRTKLEAMQEKRHSRRDNSF